jgi:F-type H+-transporting ATPase subunit a
MNGRARGILIAVAAVVLIGVSFAVPDVRGHLDGHIPEGEHWSLLVQLFPGLVENVHHVIAPHKTYVAGETPNRVSHMFMALLVVLVAIGFGWAVRRRLTRGADPIVPERSFSPFSFMEMLVEAVLSLMVGVMGEKSAKRYFPLVGSLAFFILFSNLLGMIPGFVPPTDSLSTTLALGLVVFAATHFYGVREHGIAYFKHFLGPIVKWYALPLMLLMLVIEFISHLVRPCSLGVRLMGNIMGDHKVLFIFLGFGILLIPLPIMALGLVVAVVQTLVFCLLSIVYIGLAIEHEEGH